MGNIDKLVKLIKENYSITFFYSLQVLHLTILSKISKIFIILNLFLERFDSHSLGNYQGFFFIP